MILKNMDLQSFFNYANGKRIILFGTGAMLKDYAVPNFREDFINQIVYCLDNFNTEPVLINERAFSVYNPSTISREKACIILIISSYSSLEMYQQLLKMNLPDSVECFVFTLMLSVSTGKREEWFEKQLLAEKEPQIDKVIHCFWFSGDEKPLLYKKCVQSWEKLCPDYVIKEWNMNNYDYTKNKFMLQAIEKKKWAFASDYARLDVIYNTGGIYMDMDMELIKSPTALLSNKAFFSYDSQNNIDLGIFGAVKGNKLIKAILDLYENASFLDEKGNPQMDYFCQPKYIRQTLGKFGVKLNGSLQRLNDMLFLSRCYLMPMDSIIFENYALCEETIGIHHFNAGWKESDYRHMKLNNNRKLLNLVQSAKD